MASTPKPLKIGQKVTITRTGSKHAGGKIENIRDSGRGIWYEVQVGDKRNPMIASYRGGDLQRA